MLPLFNSAFKSTSQHIERQIAPKTLHPLFQRAMAYSRPAEPLSFWEKYTMFTGLTGLVGGAGYGINAAIDDNLDNEKKMSPKKIATITVQTAGYGVFGGAVGLLGLPLVAPIMAIYSVKSYLHNKNQKPDEPAPPRL